MGYQERIYTTFQASYWITLILRTGRKLNEFAVIVWLYWRRGLQDIMTTRFNIFILISVRKINEMRRTRMHAWSQSVPRRWTGNHRPPVTYMVRLCKYGLLFVCNLQRQCFILECPSRFPLYRLHIHEYFGRMQWSHGFVDKQ